MPFQSSTPSYDDALNPTKAAIAKHTSRRGLFGRRCICGKRWGRLGCEDRLPELFAYLQTSTAAVRATDLRHNLNLFTTFEAEIIEANDRRNSARRNAAATERHIAEPTPVVSAPVWQQPYPQPTWAEPEDRTSLPVKTPHSRLFEPVRAVAQVPRQLQPIPYPVDTGVFS